MKPLEVLRLQVLKGIYTYIGTIESSPSQCGSLYTSEDGDVLGFYTISSYDLLTLELPLACASAILLHSCDYNT